MSEAEIYRELSRYRITESIHAGPTDIGVTIEPEDLHKRTSPDFALWLTVNFSIFGRSVRLRVPIPIEAEKAGISAALEDLDKLIQRKQLRIEYPYLVISSDGYDSRRLERSLPAEVIIRQIPERDVHR